MQAIKQAGKVLASTMAMAFIVLAFLLTWLAFVAEGGGYVDASIACLSMAVGAGSLGGAVLAWLWLRTF